MFKPSSILDPLREIGQYFKKAVPKPLPLSELSVSEDVYKVASMDFFDPLADYLQYKAEVSQKETLGDMLADSDIIDLLCEGILYPFVKETGLPAPWKKKQPYAHQVVLGWHICLMQCCESLRMRQKLIKCGCIYLLLTELQNMKLVKCTDTGINEFSTELIEKAISVVGSCLLDNVDIFMRLHPDTDIDGTFTSYLNYSDSFVRLVCQLTYHHFAFYLHQSSPGSMDSHASILCYTGLLRIASEEKKFVATVHKDLFIGGIYLMKVLQCLCISAKNRKFLVESSDFHKTVTNLLLGEGKEEIECVLNLLLTYLTEGQPIAKTDLAKKKGKKEQLPAEDSREETKKELLSHFPEIVCQLKNVLACRYGDVKCLKKLCSAVLWCIQANQDGDVQSCLDYVKCCYEYRHFGECCYWSDCNEQQLSTNAEAKRLRDHFLLYKAKAKYFIYQREQVVFRRSEESLGRGEMKQDRERVYKNTKEVVSILGFLKANNFPLDLKCEQFLDYALMDYIRESIKCTKDLAYCMLCLGEKKLVHSHTIPEGLLKIIFKKGRGAKMVKMGPSRLSLDSRAKTIHTLTFNMLCNTCDNKVLSRDENLFIGNIAKPVYQTSPISHLEKFDKISYDKWLYRFCAGIIFRNLPLSREVTSFTNSDDIHELFCYCRSVVSTSVQEDAEKKLTASEVQFNFAIFFTPGMPEDQPSNPKGKSSNIVRALNLYTFSNLSDISISGTSTDLAGKCYFFAVHFGIFTIVALLEPIPDEYRQFLVDRLSGELSIPANNARLSLIPPGLLKIFEEFTEKSRTHYLETLVEAKQEIEDVSLIMLKSNVAESLTGGPASFNLLPPKYVLCRLKNKLTMKEGHSILLHCTRQLPSASHTVFLAVEDKAPMNPYIIVRSYFDAPTFVSQTFGYFVSLPEFAFKDELDASRSVFMQDICRQLKKEIQSFCLEVFPDTMKRAGLQNYQSILYHLNRNRMFDKKCIPGHGCWHCQFKCDVCMLEGTAGFIFSESEEAEHSLVFHDEKCKAFSDRSRELPSSPSLDESVKEVTFHVIPSDSSEVIAMHLLSIALSTYDELKESPTHIAIDIYRVQKGNDQLPPGHFIALFDVSTYNSKIFGEYFLTDELQLEKPLPHGHVRETLENELIRLRINYVILVALQKNSLDAKHVHSLCPQTVDDQPRL